MFEPVPFAGAIHEEIFPVPLAVSPILILEFVHAKVAPEGVLTKLPTFIVAPGQTAILDIEETEGLGYIVTVNVIGEPWQPLRVGITEIVPTIFTPVAFAGAVQEAIFPDPFAPSPIDVFEFVHVYVEPTGLLEKFPIVIVEPGQTEILLIALTVGVGYMVTLKFIGGP